MLSNNLFYDNPMATRKPLHQVPKNPDPHDIIVSTFEYKGTAPKVVPEVVVDLQAYTATNRSVQVCRLDHQSLLARSHIPSASGPFSALTPSMWPQEILAKYTQKEEAVEQPEFCYDEFGFRVDKEGETAPRV
eukprot:bmy_02194T0